MSTSSAATTARQGENTTVPDPVVIDTKPAVVTWQSGDRTCVLHHNIKFEASYDAFQHTAYLKLSTAIALQELPPKSRVGLHLFIDPERALGMTLDESTVISTLPEVRTVLGTTAWCLHLDLTRPADLIGPRMSLTPRGDWGAEALNGLRALAQNTRLDILFSHRAAARAVLTSLCQVFLKCTRDPRQPNLGRMYQGKGGILLDPSAPLAPVEPAERPPAYKDCTPGPSGPPFDFSRPEKRRRVDDGGQLWALQTRAEAVLEAACRSESEAKRTAFKAEVKAELEAELKADLKAGLGAEFKAELKADLEAELGAEFKAQFKAELLAELLAELQTELQDHTARAIEQRLPTITAAHELEGQIRRIRAETMAAVQEELGRLEKSLTNQVDGLRSEIEDNADCQLEETSSTLRCELQDFVRDEIRDAERRIRQRLQARTLTAHIHLADSDSDT